MKYALRRVLTTFSLLLWVPLACSTADSALDPNPTGGNTAGGATGTSVVTGGTLGETGGTASGGVLGMGAAAAGGSASGGSATGGSASGGSGAGGKSPVGGGTAGSSGGSTGTTPCSSSNCKGVCVAQDEGGCSGVWKCVNDPGICTTDIAPFCGCDGKTFSSSSSCVANAWSHRGSCEAGVDCDPGKITCRRATPSCPAGYVPSVVGSCYGPCVRMQECTCKSSDQCPAKPSACSQVSNRCVAPVF
ncbi:MAG: hypothetical protein SGI86_10165 [Deltaproteobacteria bacterium]|nr:hypothetical protein [Deltaproteobacteria bacterium]